MGTSCCGAFVLSWTQTEVDGLSEAPVSTLRIGATWRWSGDVVRVDGPAELLRLDNAQKGKTRRRCAAKLVKRLVVAAQSGCSDPETRIVEPALADCGFVVTNGLRSFTVTLIEVGRGAPPLLLFLDDIPPRDTELWVVHHSMPSGQTDVNRPEAGGVICFTPGTRITTPDGLRPVEELREGDYVLTKDNGAQQVQWIGKRRMTGARLFAMPHLRPVRLRAGALGIERPDQELLVSPDHRMLISGAVAQTLFNTSEVLVSARDMINDRTIAVDLAVREVTYIHLLLPRHQVLWANGVETESFHPASAALTALDPEDRARLMAFDQRIELTPDAYGAFARRRLTTSEAALLLHETAA